MFHTHKYLELINRCGLLNAIVDESIIDGNKLIGEQFYRLMRRTAA